MFHVWHRDIQNVLELLRNTEELSHALALLTKLLVNAECRFGVDARHFKVMLWEMISVC
jgi:hypothetical protein